MKLLTLALALPFVVALAVALHALAAALVKAVWWSFRPLSRGEHEVCTYERRIYHSALPHAWQVIGTAAAAGVAGWVAMAGWLPGAGVAALLLWLGALAMDLLGWQRVALSAEHLWFQRGLRGRVHQVAVENIRDLAVETTDVGGLTLRHGRRNRLVRLKVRMTDKRVIALPKTDGWRDAEAVETMALQLRARLAKRDRAERPIGAAAAEQAESDEAALRRTLRRLRRARIQAAGTDRQAA